MNTQSSILDGKWAQAGDRRSSLRAVCADRITDGVRATAGRRPGRRPVLCGGKRDQEEYDLEYSPTVVGHKR